MQKHRKIKPCLIVLVIYLVALTLLPNSTQAAFWGDPVLISSNLGTSLTYHQVADNMSEYGDLHAGCSGQNFTTGSLGAARYISQVRFNGYRFGGSPVGNISARLYLQSAMTNDTDPDLGLVAETPKYDINTFTPSGWHSLDFSEPSPDLFEYYNTGMTTSGHSVYLSYWAAQNFTTGNIPTTITSVKLLITKSGYRSMTLTVGIRAVDASGHPTGSDLSLGTADASDWSEAPAGEWHEVQMSPYLLASKTQYAIVMRVLDPKGDENLGWLIDTTGNYADGMVQLSSNSGSSWTENAATDFGFEVYGYNGEYPYELQDTTTYVLAFCGWDSNFATEGRGLTLSHNSSDPIANHRYWRWYNGSWSNYEGYMAPWDLHYQVYASEWLDIFDCYVDVTSSPQASFEINGTGYSTPQTDLLLYNLTYSFSVPAEFMSGGRIYYFESWLINGSTTSTANPLILALNGNTTLEMNWESNVERAVGITTPYAYAAITVWSIAFMVAIGAGIVVAMQSQEFSMEMAFTVILGIGILIALFIALPLLNAFAGL